MNIDPIFLALIFRSKFSILFSCISGYLNCVLGVVNVTQLIHCLFIRKSSFLYIAAWWKQRTWTRKWILSNRILSQPYLLYHTKWVSWFLFGCLSLLMYSWMECLLLAPSAIIFYFFDTMPQKMLHREWNTDSFDYRRFKVVFLLYQCSVTSWRPFLRNYKYIELDAFDANRMYTPFCICHSLLC